MILLKTSVDGRPNIISCAATRWLFSLFRIFKGTSMKGDLTLWHDVTPFYNCAFAVFRCVILFYSFASLLQYALIMWMTVSKIMCRVWD